MNFDSLTEQQLLVELENCNQWHVEPTPMRGWWARAALLVVGLGLLYIVHKGHADGRAPVPGSSDALPSSSADTTTVADDSTVRPATGQAGGRPPLRPAGHHKAA
jgi:hypothetical protein